jgi:predicted nucleic acid-binding protein
MARPESRAHRPRQGRAASLIVDASVVIKWFVVEDLRPEARRLQPVSHRLAAPDFLLLELSNIAWRKARQGAMPVEDAAVVAPAVRRSGVRLLSTDPLIDQAFDLAREFDHPVYDCLYVAAMDLLGARFVTWDKPLHAKLAGSRFGASVYLLSEVDGLLDDLGAEA